MRGSGVLNASGRQPGAAESYMASYGYLAHGSGGYGPARMTSSPMLTYNPHHPMQLSRTTLVHSGPGGVGYESASHEFVDPEAPAAGCSSDFSQSAGERSKGLGSDQPSFRSLPGVAVILLFTMMTISLFLCLARPDFNFVIYLLGYQVWCVESDALSTPPTLRLMGAGREGVTEGGRGAHGDSAAATAALMRSSEIGGGRPPSWMNRFRCTRRMAKIVRRYVVVMVFASVIDASWLLVAHSAWTCDPSTGNNPLWCFGAEDVRIAAVFGLHRFALLGSVTNLTLKVIFIILSLVWTSGDET